MTKCPRNHFPYYIKPGDTLYYIAARLGVNHEQIIAANPGINPYNLKIGDSLCIPICPAHHTVYIIQPGDTLNKIAQKYNTSVESILEVNPSVEPDYLRVAQRICIPKACPDYYEDIITAMQSDIDFLKSQSSTQKLSESNIEDSKLTIALDVTENELQFQVVSHTFFGDYRGRFNNGESYPFYQRSVSGHKAIVVRDDFGVWHSFTYGA